MSLGSSYEQISNVLAAIHEGEKQCVEEAGELLAEAIAAGRRVIFSVPGIHCFP